MGIGGLDNQNDMFRRVFASRLHPPELVQTLGIQHTRGQSSTYVQLLSIFRTVVLQVLFYMDHLEQANRSLPNKLE